MIIGEIVAYALSEHSLLARFDAPDLVPVVELGDERGPLGLAGSF